MANVRICDYFYIFASFFSRYFAFFNLINKNFPYFIIFKILDQDISVTKALIYPPLYKTLKKGRELNLKTFLSWVWKSLFQVNIF